MEEYRESIHSRAGTGCRVSDDRVALCVSRGNDHRRLRPRNCALPDTAWTGHACGSKEDCGGGIKTSGQYAAFEEGIMSLVETASKDRGTALAEERTDLAIQRTIIAAERTLMAWTRTAISMIGFGFSIYKFFQSQAEEIAAGNIRRPQAPRNLGMSLIALGTVALSAAAWQHRRFLKEIGANQTRHVLSVSYVVAICVILI